MTEMTSKVRIVDRVVKPALTRNVKITDVMLPRESIEKKAYEIASKHLSYDDYVWLWAESELKVGNAIANGSALKDGKVQVDISKIVQKPASNDIKKLASEFASKRTKPETIHWYIAERQVLLDRASLG